MQIDLAQYLACTGHCGPLEPTVETLHALVAAHNGAIMLRRAAAQPL